MYAFSKRVFDILFSLAGLCILSPILLIIAIAIQGEDSGPVFYRGTRVGLKGGPFRIFKFRTMVVDAEQKGVTSTAEDDGRITRVGKFLRRYKLDEFPQLMNVLKGEMSFVGPRPQVQWAVALYSENEKKILDVLPGITDYASIRFSNEADILKGSTDPDKDYMEKIAPEKMRLGLEYARTRSFWTDLKIIFMTMKIIIFGANSLK